MKASEFKKLIKPLVMQSVREVLLQEGVLSSIVSEVARGLGKPILENKQSHDDLRLKEERLEKQRQQRIKKLNESNKFGDVFSGTKEISDNNSNGPLSGVSSADSGVDITDIEKIASGRWKALMG
jgi:hypothetical protein